MTTTEIVDAHRETGNQAVTTPPTPQPPPTPLPPLPPQRRRRADRAREIADVLRQQIVDGDLREATLPVETALVREFGASRNTVREALGLLRAEGLVERVPGIGTFVVCEKYAHGLNTLLGLGETLVGHGRVSNEIRSAGSVTAPPAVARRLGLAGSTRVVYLERLRSLNGLVLSLDLTYLHPDVGAAVLAEDLVANDVFVLIERLCGKRLGVADISVEAVNADPHSAALLQVPEGGALLMVERLAHLPADGADGRTLRRPGPHDPRRDAPSARRGVAAVRANGPVRHA